MVLFALVLVATMGNAQVLTQTASDLYTVEVIGGSLAVAVGTAGEVTGLSPGFTYTLLPDVAGNLANAVIPIINGTEAGTPMEFDITADPGVAVQVTFTLPTILTGQGMGSSISCSFGSQSLYVVETGALLNPNVPNTLTSGAGGAGWTLDLGITVTIPPATLPDTYQGVVACMGVITGF
jgi:hypothetical protein